MGTRINDDNPTFVDEKHVPVSGSGDEFAQSDEESFTALIAEGKDTLAPVSPGGSLGRLG